MTDPFHLSFRVRDLARSRAFYEKALGCSVGREQPGWLDIDFFGHQVTLHQERSPKCARPGVGEALDHYGLQLDPERWRALRARLETARAQFRVKPVVHNAGKENETGKLVVVDPDGFGLEFKYGSPAGAKERLMYVERASGSNEHGPAWIGRAMLSKSGRTVYFNGLALKRAGGRGASASHVCVETGDEYHVSEPRRDGMDQHAEGGGPVLVDERVLADYLELRGLAELDPTHYQVVADIRDTDRERFHRLENEPLRRPVRTRTGAGAGTREWLVMTASRCLVDGEPSSSLDVSVHYYLAASEKEARAKVPTGIHESYESADGEQVSWELVEIMAVEEFGRVSSGDEVVGFIAQFDELSDLAT